MLSLDVELQRYKLFQLAQAGNLKALQRCKESQQYAAEAWDALIAIQAARNNDWALLGWVIQMGLPTTLGFSECRSISDRERITAREALYYKHHHPPLPTRANYLLPAFRKAFVKRVVADAEMLRLKKDTGRTSEEDIPCRPISAEEYVFMEPDATTAAFLQGHLDMMNWLLGRPGGIHPGHSLLRYEIVHQAMAIPAPLHSVEWIITQSTFHTSSIAPIFLAEALCSAATFKRQEYIGFLGQRYGAFLDTERKEQVLWFLSTHKHREALQLLLQLPPWHTCQVPSWPLTDDEEVDEDNDTSSI